VRDAQNVPIIRASADPAKVRPEDPGGTNAPHQDVKSYEIAEAEQPSAVAALVAPEPAKPSREDVAMGDLQDKPDQNEVDDLVGQVIGELAQEANTQDTTASLAVQPAQPALQQAAATQPSVEQTQPTAPAPAAAVATPLPSDPDEQVDVATLGTTDTQANTLQPVQPATPADDVQEQPEQPEIVGGTEYAPAVSPTARARPSNLVTRVQNAAAEAKQDETNLAAAAANSSVQIQLAADPSESAIRNRWRTVFNANKDILRDKALAIQSTQSGGTTFYRLRVGPFKNRSEAVAVCQALKARGQDCLVARNS